MKKLKLVAIIMLLLVASTGWAATYTTTRINVPSSYNEGTTRHLPAVVRGQNGAIAALETVVLALPATKSGQIAAALAMAGLTYGANKIFDYLDSEGFPINPETGIPRKKIVTDEYGPTTNGEPAQPVACNALECSYALNQSMAKARADAKSSDDCESTGPGADGCGSGYFGMTARQKNEAGNCVIYSNPEVPAAPYIATVCYPYYDGVHDVTKTGQTTTYVPTTQEELKDLITGGIEAGNPDANDALTDTLKRTNKALEDLNDTLRRNENWPSIQGGLDNSITTETKTSLDTKLADPNATGNYASETTTTTTTTSTNTTTNNTTTNNYYENDGTFAPLSPYNQGTQTTKTAFEQPEVGDFSQLMTDFIETMQETDLFSLPGLMTGSIPSGGDCQLTINLGSHFGGTKTVSFCEWATALSYIKAVLLCLASVVAVGIVCKGGTA